MKKKIFILTLILAVYTYGATTTDAAVKVEEKVVTETKPVATLTPTKKITEKPNVKDTTHTKDNKKTTTVQENNSSVVSSNIPPNVKLITDEFNKRTVDLIYSDAEKSELDKIIKEKKVSEAEKQRINLDNKVRIMEEKASAVFRKYLPNGIPKDLTKKRLEDLKKEVNEKNNQDLVAKNFFKAIFFEMDSLMVYSEDFSKINFENIENKYNELTGYKCNKLLEVYKEEILNKYIPIYEFYTFSKGLIADNDFSIEDEIKFSKEAKEKKIPETIVASFEKSLSKMSTKKETILVKKEQVANENKEENKVKTLIIGILGSIVFGIIILIALIINRKKTTKINENINDSQKNEKALNIGQASHQGKRKEQQDDYKWSNISNDKFIEHGGILAVVCDGMGGMKNGKDASKLASAVFVKEYSAKKPSEKVSDALYRALLRTNESVYQETKRLGVEGASGTTLIATVIKDNKLNFVSVGDSFIYLLRDKELSILNKQHIYRNKLVEEYTLGKRSFESIDLDPNVKGLTSYIGGSQIAEIDLLRLGFPLKNGDIVVLASDGLSDALNNDEIKEILERPLNAPDLANKLVEKAIGKNRVNQDNTTVLVLRVGE